jgi:hypothetical protein
MMMQKLSQRMRRLLASDLLPARAGQPVKALVHISFADLCQLDADAGIQDKWIEDYRARWAAYRAAASVATGDGGAWLDGDAARAIACDAMIVPVVTGDLDPGAVEAPITLCVQYDRLRGHAGSPGDGRADSAGGTGPDGGGPDGAGSTGPQAGPGPGGSAAEVLAMLEHQILGQVLAIVSGPGGVASFLRRNLMAAGWAGRRCRWMSGRPTRSRRTCGGWSRCATRPASTPAAVTSRRPGASRTTWCTGPTAAGPA